VDSPPVSPPSSTSSSEITVNYASTQTNTLTQLDGRGGVAGVETTNTANENSLTWSVTGPSGTGAPVYPEIVSIVANYSSILSANAGVTAFGFNLASTNFNATVTAQGNFEVTSPSGTLLYEMPDFAANNSSFECYVQHDDSRPGFSRRDCCMERESPDHRRSRAKPGDGLCKHDIWIHL
jgi:hypothetical protein